MSLNQFANVEMDIAELKSLIATHQLTRDGGDIILRPVVCKDSVSSDLTLVVEVRNASTGTTTSTMIEVVLCGNGTHMIKAKVPV